ncbi:MAG: flagellar basal body rod protein FlgC [Woeseiaceae bacterium]|nr:flagellar basal body rod protein FlgC [Woeseiaceae bacterium]
MSLFNVFDTAGSAMNAQSVRMNVTSSNLANAGNVSGNPENVYRAKHPVFASFQDTLNAQSGVSGVRMEGIVESNAPIQQVYQPGHPEADDEGFVWATNVNAIEEMVNMISASRSYKNNVEIINTTKDLLTQTLQMGR